MKEIKYKQHVFYGDDSQKGRKETAESLHKRFSQTIVLPPCAGSYMSSPSTAAGPNDD